MASDLYLECMDDQNSISKCVCNMLQVLFQLQAILAKAFTHLDLF